MNRIRFKTRDHCLGTAEVGHDEHVLDTRQPRQNASQFVGEIDLFAGVKVAVTGDQHFRLDLAEAIDDALNAKIGRTGGPHGADRGRAEQPATDSGILGSMAATRSSDRRERL